MMPIPAHWIRHLTWRAGRRTFWFQRSDGAQVVRCVPSENRKGWRGIAPYIPGATWVHGKTAAATIKLLDEQWPIPAAPITGVAQQPPTEGQRLHVALRFTK